MSANKEFPIGTKYIEVDKFTKILLAITGFLISFMLMIGTNQLLHISAQTAELHKDLQEVNLQMARLSTTVNANITQNVNRLEDKVNRLETTVNELNSKILLMETRTTNQ